MEECLSTNICANYSKIIFSYYFFLVEGFFIFTKHEPVGVVGQIIPVRTYTPTHIQRHFNVHTTSS